MPMHASIGRSTAGSATSYPCVQRSRRSSASTLFTRDFAPLPERLESIASRLDAAPRYLDETRERVTDPVELWTEIDIQSTEMLPSFLDTILAAARSEAD